jgi:hypothetical protein
MPKLYELTDEYATLLSKVAELEGEVTPEMDQLLQVVGGEINVKIENIAKLVKNLEGDMDAFKNESGRLYDKAKSAKNHIDWLKGYMKSAMEKANISEVKGEVLKIAIRPSQPSVVVLDDRMIPTEFVRVIPETKEPDKRAIIANYKAGGEQIPGTQIAIGLTLTIK